MITRRHDGKGARQLVQRLRPIYRDAYADPPYGYDDADADEFVERMTAQTEQPGFVLVTAHVPGQVDGELAGFSYGYRFPDGKWWRGAQTDPPAEVAAGSKFAVIELVVSRQHRGRGYSRRLLGDLLDGRGEDFAVLLAKPGAQAHAMYERWGWRAVGVVQSYPHWPVDDAMVLPLGGAHRVAV